MKTIQITIESGADSTERGIKALLAKRKLSNVAEVRASYNPWENCTDIDVRFRGEHAFEVRFQKMKSGKITRHEF